MLWLGLCALSFAGGRSSIILGSPASHDADHFPLCEASRFREAKAKAYQKDLPIIMVLTILFFALSVLLGLWQAPVPTLISAL